MEKIAYECDLLDAMNAALEFRVVQVGYVKYTDVEDTEDDVDEENPLEVKYDLYRTLSDIPIYVIIDKIDKIKIIGINDTVLPQYTMA